MRAQANTMAYDNSRTYSENQQDWRIASAFSKYKVTARVLETHPCIDDVVKLININDYLFERMNGSERATWGAYWNIVFYKKKKLKDKAWNKFESISHAIDEREQQNRDHLNQIRSIRDKLQQLEQNPKNKDHNEETKGSDLSKVKRY